MLVHFTPARSLVSRPGRLHSPSTETHRGIGLCQDNVHRSDGLMLASQPSTSPSVSQVMYSGGRDFAVPFGVFIALAAAWFRSGLGFGLDVDISLW